MAAAVYQILFEKSQNKTYTCHIVSYSVFWYVNYAVLKNAVTVHFQSNVQEFANYWQLKWKKTFHASSKGCLFFSLGQSCRLSGGDVKETRKKLVHTFSENLIQYWSTVISIEWQATDTDTAWYRKCKTITNFIRCYLGLIITNIIHS